METLSKDLDIYYTIEDSARAEVKIKASRFIASVFPVNTKEKAMEALGAVKTEFHDARHHCFAYRFGSDGMEFRAVDDGEPSGSAGKPILFAIKKFDFSDILVVVTRYFGGVKLGVGGLARAYGEASELALAESKSKPVHITTPVQIFCTYEDIDIIKKLVIQSAISFKEDYQDAVKIIANIHRSKVNPFISQITESTKGRAGAIILTNTESI
jgi:uncharacterized YigZ family protein